MKSQTENHYLSSLPLRIYIPVNESWVILDEGDNDVEQTIILSE